MIRCPTCGTLNQDSRRVCTKCGTALPQTQVRCPNCGTLNRVGNAFCDNCNTRLVRPSEVAPSPSAPAQEETKGNPVRGISLPVRPTTPQESESTDEALPDWLRGLVDETEVTQEEPSSAEPVPDSDQYPDWLSGLLDESTEFGETESEEPEADEELTFEPDALPDWLAGAEEATPAQEEVDEEGDAEPLPDWLAALAVEDDDSAGAQGLPDWLGGSDEALAVDEPGPESESELPDWLRSVGEAEMPADSEPVPPTSAEVPDWLSALGVDTQPEAPHADERPQAREARPAEPTPQPKKADQVSPREPSPADQALIFSESELPDWLAEARALGSEEDSAALEASEGEPGESLELPDWLTSLASDEPDGEDLPEWLTGRPAGGTEAPAESELPEAPPELPADLPDWLTELAPSTDTEPSTAIFTEAPPDSLAESPLPPESPGWLRDIAKYGKDLAAETSAPVFVGEEAAPPPEEEPPAPEDAPQEPLPSWLRELDLAAQEEPQQDVAYEEEETLARANLPNWLQELAPPQASPGAEGEPSIAIASGLVPADIPDWVQALRPEAPPEGKARHDRGPLPTPAEPTGPLEGLPGVLTPFALVDVPAQARPIVNLAIPEAVRTQAQVWQRLLEQPRSSARPVAKERPQNRQAVRFVRLLVAAVVFLGVFGAFWLLPQGVQLAEINPVDIAPGVGALVDAVNQAQPGDRVLIALEYTPAYAEEMEQIAVPILDHLATREVEVIFVSTLPEGATLGAALAAQVPGLTTTVSHYLPGEANGISEYLSRSEAQSAQQLLVLAAQPQHLRWWIEQNASVVSNGREPLPMNVGASAATGRLVAPYLQSASVQGWVTGFPQALAYRDASGIGTSDAYRQVLDILMLAHWAVAALLAFGLLYTLVAGRKGAR